MYDYELEQLIATLHNKLTELAFTGKSILIIDVILLLVYKSEQFGSVLEQQYCNLYRRC